MSYRADKLGDGRTDRGNDNTRRPKLASGKNLMLALNELFQIDIAWLLVEYVE